MRLNRKNKLSALISIFLFIFLIISSTPIQHYTWQGNLVIASTSNTQATTKINLPLAADSDDDYWHFYNGNWQHYTDDTIIYVRDYTDTGTYYGQFRFSLPIPKNSFIHKATISVYEINENSFTDAIIKRIDETDVSSLESDVSTPFVTDKNVAYHYFEKTDTEWVTTDITSMVQDQIDLEGWDSNNYFGVQFCMTQAVDEGLEANGENYFEDYSHSDSHHAYMEIDYAIDTDMNWLTGWNYRKQYFIKQNSSLSSDFKIPIYVSLGEGTSHDKVININNKAQQSFDDIRFTQNDGQTLLDYWLEEIVSEETTNYFTYDAVDFANYPSNYPSSWYYNDRTYIVFQGDLREGFEDFNLDLDAHIIYYDHENDSWSGIFYIGNNKALDRANKQDDRRDDHGPPALWIDNEGYIHVVYGAHNMNLVHSKSSHPENITSWNREPDITTTRATYPKFNYDYSNNKTYLTYRRQDLDYQRYVLRISNDNGKTWGKERILLDIPGSVPYQDIEGLDIKNNLLHFGWRNYKKSITTNINIYYSYLNLTDNNLYNVSRYNLGSYVDLNEMEESSIVYDTNGRATYGPILHVDSNGYPYLFFAQDFNTFDKTTFIYWTGSTWSSAEDVSDPSHIGAGMDFIVHESNNITAFLSHNRDMTRWTWDGSDWTNEEIILSAPGNIMLSFSTIPGYWNYNYHPELKVSFTEYEPNEDGDGKKMRAYAWESNGILHRTSAKYAKFWVKLHGNVAISNQIIYCYYGNPLAISEAIAPFGSDGYTYSEVGIEKRSNQRISETTSNNLNSFNNPATISNYTNNPATISNYTEYITLENNDSDFLWFSTILLNNLVFLGFTY